MWVYFKHKAVWHLSREPWNTGSRAVRTSRWAHPLYRWRRLLTLGVTIHTSLQDGNEAWFRQLVKLKTRSLCHGRHFSFMLPCTMTPKIAAGRPTLLYGRTAKPSCAENSYISVLVTCTAGWTFRFCTNQYTPDFHAACMCLHLEKWKKKHFLF